MPPSTCSEPSAAANWDGASTPFCNGTTNVSGPIMGRMASAACVTCQAFTPTRTTSALSTCAGSSVARVGRNAASPAGLSMQRPCLRIALKWSPRAMKMTSAPARVSCAPKYPPAPPVPKTTTRMVAPALAGRTLLRASVQFGSARRVARQTHREHRALARFACHGHVATHHARELASDGKAEPSTAVATRRQGIGLGEILKQFRLLFGGHADTGIRNRKLDPVAAVRHLAHPQRDLAIFRELAGIAQEIEQNLLEPHGVSLERAHALL